jgi:hypothetical protein
MTVTWTSGYGIDEAYPLVEWGIKWSPPVRTAAGTVTFDRDTICGMVPIKDSHLYHSSIAKDHTYLSWLHQVFDRYTN